MMIFYLYLVKDEIIIWLFATEKKKIAQFLRSKGVSVKLLNAAMAIK